MPHLADVLSPINPEFWRALYATGRFGEFNDNTIVLILVRLAVVVLLFVAARIFVIVLDRIIKHGVTSINSHTGQAQRRLTTLYSLLSSTLAYTIYFVVLVLMMFVLGLTWKAIAPLLGAASVVGLAIGFGAQKLVRDVITGLFLLGEGQFDVDDWVTIGGVTGRVEFIGLRITRIRDEQGRLCVIANGDISQVYNASRGAVKLVMPVSVKREAPLQGVIETIQRITDETLTTYDQPDVEERFSLIVAGSDATQINLRLTLWICVDKKDLIEDTLRRRLLVEVENLAAMAV